MATRTIGTAATTTLTGVLYLPGYGSGLLPADLATIRNGIKDDINPAHPIFPGALVDGVLRWPNRQGYVEVLPGDFVAIDGQGWPVLVSKNSAGSASWVHT